MIHTLVRLIERLNFSQGTHDLGAHFPQILAFLSIIFGGSFLLFAWKHHEYYLGITGLLVGGWVGLLMKHHVAPAGHIPPFLYLGVCGVAGAFVAVQFRQFVGVLLGGFTAACLMSIAAPSMFRAGEAGLPAVSAAFLMGGGLGAMFPKFFFVLNSSLIGSIFMTYGISTALLASVAAATPQAKVTLHLLVFLPLLVFGVLYQMVTSQREELPIFVAAAPPPAPAPSAR